MKRSMVMARVASGKEVLVQAKELLVNASTIEELRQAQAVVLPLELGLSMEQTATAIGTSIGCNFTTGGPFCAVSEAWWCLASFPSHQNQNSNEETGNK